VSGIGVLLQFGFFLDFVGFGQAGEIIAGSPAKSILPQIFVYTLHKKISLGISHLELPFPQYKETSQAMSF
jgi:hypothetical protein